MWSDLAFFASFERSVMITNMEIWFIEQRKVAVRQEGGACTACHGKFLFDEVGVGRVG